MGLYRFIVDKKKIIGALLDDIFFSVEEFMGNSRLYREYKKFIKRKHLKKEAVKK
jgi:hypothetical protein